MEVLKIRNDANSPWVDILALVGPKGFSPIVKVEEGEKTITVTVTDEEGQTSAVIDLNNYYNKQETDGAIEAAVTAIDLEPYALKSEIPSLEGYATETWVTEQIGNIPVIDLTPYALKSEIPVIPVDISAFNNDVGYLTAQSLDGYAKTENIPTIPTKVSAFANDVGYLTNHQSLVGYATKEYVDESVSNVDVRLQLNKYALKTEIPTVPDKVSSFENDAGYLTEHQSLEEYAKKSDIPEIPEIPDKISAFYNDVGYLTEHQSLEGYATRDYMEGVVEGLKVDLTPYATVVQVQGVSDDVDALDDKLDNYALKTEIPEVPIKVSELFNDAGYLTEHQSLEGYATEKYVDTAVANVKVDLTGYATEKWVEEQIEDINIPTVDLTPYALKTDIPTIPTKVSAFENDKGYLTQHQSLDGLASEEYVNTAVSNVKVDLTGYATETYVQEQIEGIEITADAVEEVYIGSTEPSADSNAVLWINPDGEANTTLATTDYVDNAVANVQVDLTGYATEEYVQKQIENVSVGDFDLSEYAKKTEIPIVPTKVSAFTNDAGYITASAIPDVSAYQTEEQVLALINTQLGVIENGSY